MIEANKVPLRNGVDMEAFRKNLIFNSRLIKDKMMINETFIDPSLQEPEPDDQLMVDQYPKIKEIHNIEETLDYILKYKKHMNNKDELKTL